MMMMGQKFQSIVSGENVLEEIKDNDLNQPHKHRKGAGDSAIVNSEEQIDVAID